MEMSIHQAARWAERQSARDLYVAYDDSHTVCCLGGYEKCVAFIKAACSTPHVCHGFYYELNVPYKRDGYSWDCRTLRLYSLDALREEMAESDAENFCIPCASEQREWA